MPELPGIEFRQFQPDDLDEVLTLEQSAYGNPELCGKLVMNLSDLQDIPGRYFPSGNFLVGVHDSRIVAMGGVRQKLDNLGEPIEGVATIGRMRTEFGLQGCGIGRRLLETLEAQARALRYGSVVLSTSVEQEKAIRLYELNGYRMTHCEPYRVMELHFAKALNLRSDS